MNRRSFLTGLICAPAIVPIRSLMPLRGIILPTKTQLEIINDAMEKLAYGRARWMTQWEELAGLIRPQLYTKPLSEQIKIHIPGQPA